MSFNPTVTILRTYFEKRRMFAFNVSTSFMAAGHFIHPIMMQAAFNYYGYSGFLYVWAAVALQTCVGGALLRPLEENYSRHYITLREDSNKEIGTSGCYEQISEQGLGAKETEISLRKESDKLFHASLKRGCMNQIADRKEDKSLRLLIRSWFDKLWLGRSQVAFMISILMSTLGYYPAIILVVDMLMERGETMNHVVVTTVIINVFDVASRLLVSLLLDKERFKPYRKRFFMAFPLTTGLACLGFALSRTRGWNYFYFAIGGISISNINGMCYVILGDIVTLEAYATMVALLGVIQGTGHLFGSLITGVSHLFR